MIAQEVITQIFRYRCEHGALAPKEHWMDRATFDRMCDEVEKELRLFPQDPWRCSLRDPPARILGVPVRIWDES